GSRRMQRQIPSTSVELHTDRDRLRAEYALLSQKLGTRLESARMKMAEQMAEVTRTRNRIETLVAELNAKDVAHAAREEEALELRARLSEYIATVAEAQSEITVLRLDLDHKSMEVTELQAMIADRDAHIASLAPPPEVILAASDPGVDSGEIAGQLVDAAAKGDPLVQQHLEESAHETGDLQNELNRLDATWTKKLGKIKTKSRKPPDSPLDEALTKRTKPLHKNILG
ncbi:MAG: hypothetical protein ACREDX_10440, partial [Aestuariivirga sp.]